MAAAGLLSHTFAAVAAERIRFALRGDRGTMVHLNGCGELLKNPNLSLLCRGQYMTYLESPDVNAF